MSARRFYVCIFIILRRQTFNVGVRIGMGGVCGDVNGLSFIQTKSREIHAGLDGAGLTVASATQEITVFRPDLSAQVHVDP